MARILITGAGGLLGRHLLPLLEEQDEVFAPRLDLSRPLDTATLPPQIDAVIYAAQSNRFREFPDAADDIFQVNTAQVAGMLDYARRAGARNFVYASTGGVYGTGDAPFAEDSPLARGLGFYPASKLAGEVIAEAYASQLNVAILRYFFIYGAGQKREMLVPRLIDSVREGRPITLQGGDGLRINPVHASDAARATLAAARLERSAVVNVAGPETLSLRDMAETIGEAVGKAPVLEVRADQKPGHLIADTSKMAELLVPPTRRFADGIVELL